MCCAAGRGEAGRRVWPRSEGRTHAAKAFAADASQMQQRAPHQAARSTARGAACWLLHSLLRHTLEPRARHSAPPLAAPRRLRLPASGRARPAGVSTPHAPRRRQGAAAAPLRLRVWQRTWHRSGAVTSAALGDIVGAVAATGRAQQRRRTRAQAQCRQQRSSTAPKHRRAHQEPSRSCMHADAAAQRARARHKSSNAAAPPPPPRDAPAPPTACGSAAQRLPRLRAAVMHAAARRFAPLSRHSTSCGTSSVHGAPAPALPRAICPVKAAGAQRRAKPQPRRADAIEAPRFCGRRWPSPADDARRSSRRPRSAACSGSARAAVCLATAAAVPQAAPRPDLLLRAEHSKARDAARLDGRAG